MFTLYFNPDCLQKMRCGFSLGAAVGLTAVILLVQCGSTNGTYQQVTVLMKGNQVKAEDCKYKGYIPGGGVKGIEPVATPVAKGFTSALGSVAGVIGQAAGAGRAATALAAVASSIEKVAKVAKNLSAAFGVFAAAFSIVSSFTKPTPNDILDKVNVAFAQITKDINNRLTSMEGYADGRVIELEQKLIQNEFASMRRYLTSCIRETTEPEVRTCQRLANKKIYAGLHKFQNMRDKFLAGSQNLDSYQIRSLEATLITFRDYASLHLFSLQVMVNSYRDDPPSEERTNRLKLYLEDLKSFGTKYRDYAYWAYDQIYKGQIKDNLGRGDYAEPEKVGEVWEGWPGAHTYNQQYFVAKCNPGDKQADINKCKVRRLVRYDGKQPSSMKRVPIVCQFSRYSRYQRADTRCLNKALLETGKKEMKKICDNYLAALEQDLKTYWKKELLDPADLWKEVSEKAAKAPELA